MLVTLGFAMQINSYPPAVAIAPVTQPLQGEHSVIEAEAIVASGTSANSNISRNDFMRHPYGVLLNQQQPLAYTKEGEQFFAVQEVSGRLLDMFA